MPQICTICRHEQRAQIDTALIENEPLRNIAERFGLTPTSLHRHKQHLSTELIMAKQAYEVAQATTLLDHLQYLISRLNTLAHKAEEDRAWPAAIGALREIRGCLTLLAQLTGELEASRHTNIHLSVAFERVQMTLLEASPKDFGQFCKELFEKASDEQIQAVMAGALLEKHDSAPDYSMLSDEELEILERITRRMYSKG